MKAVSDAWEELGYHKKEAVDKNPYRHFKPHPRHTHEPEHVTQERREKNIALLETLRPYAQKFEWVGSSLHLNIKGRRYEIWPSIDSYYSHPHQTFRNDIHHFVETYRNILERKQ